MKTIVNVTVYQCEFCDKKLYRRHSMVRHEDNCFSNPNNLKACMDCEHLEKVLIEVPWINGNPDYVTNTKQVEVFRCKVLDKLMFPFSIERKKLHEQFETYEEQEPMPKTCEHQKFILPFN